MPLKAQIKGELPDELKDYYKPLKDKEGVFVLDVEAVEGYRLENVDGLTSALSKERTARERAEKLAKAFEGLDADEVRQRMERLTELEQLDPNKEADKIAQSKIDAATKQLTERHQKDLTKLEEKAKRYRDRVYDREVRAAAVEAIAAEKGVPELLLPHVTSRTRLRETDDGQFLVEVIDKDGNVRIGDSNGTPMSIRGLVQEMKTQETFARAFEGSGATGSGASTNGSSNGLPSNKKAADMKLAEKSAFISKHGLDAWTKKLNDEVGTSAKS